MNLVLESRACHWLFCNLGTVSCHRCGEIMAAGIAAPLYDYLERVKRFIAAHSTCRFRKESGEAHQEVQQDQGREEPA